MDVFFFVGTTHSLNKVDFQRGPAMNLCFFGYKLYESKDMMGKTLIEKTRKH